MGICSGKPQSPSRSSQHSERLHVSEVSTTKVKDLSSPSFEVSTANWLRSKSLQKAQESQSINSVCTFGLLSTNRQSSYEDKRVSAFGPGSSPEALSSQGIAYACKKGLKPASPNQDDFSIYLEPECQFLGVYDGHGADGHTIANFVQRSLTKLITGNKHRRVKPKEVIAGAFLRTQNILEEYCEDPSNQVNCSLSGTTATVVLVQGGRLYVGHVGDSRAVVGSVVEGDYKAQALTADHKPNLPEEMARITAAGGEVKRRPYDVPYRVFKPGEDYPGLAMSRALGDSEAHNYGVSHYPEVNEFELRPTDEFVVVGSDGVWEFISDQEVVEQAAKYSRINARSAAEGIAKLAWSRWVASEGDSVDDITVLLAYLTH